MSRPFRLALPFLSVLALVSCGHDNSSPTQPVSTPTVTVAARTATPTVPPAPTATPTRSAATATPTVPPAVQIVNVGQANFVDSQSGNSTTTIRAGVTVMWVWVSGVAHSTTSGTCCMADGKWDSGIKSSGSFSRTFPTAGNFPYFCSVHLSAMTGNVVVNP